MNNRKLGTILMAVLMTVLLSLASGLAIAADGTHKKQGHGGMSPELAAKREMVRKQQEQRVTHEKRKTAAANLKAERIRIYQAKQAAKKSAP
jgi:hypothetical protein